jgi:hypothetical protein
MITYDYTMLSAGYNWRFKSPYSELAASFVEDKNKHNNAKVYLTTNDIVPNIKNLYTYKIPEKYPIFYENEEIQSTSHFNYNLKFLALKNAFQKSTSEYIIYIDSDFVFNDSYEELKIQNFLEECKRERFDIVTPLFSSGHREAYDEKYDVLEFDKNDSIFTFQEGFIVFRNTFKLKYFIDKWEELYWKLQNNKVPQIAEGLEIGIAARYADFHFSEDLYQNIMFFRKHLNNIFWSLLTEDEKLFFCHM